MSTFNIKSRDGKRIMFTCELPAEIAVDNYNAKITYAFKQALKQNVKLAGADLREVEMFYEDLSDKNFRDCDFRYASFIECNLMRCTFNKCDFREADLSHSDIDGACLINADISTTIYEGVDISLAYVTGEKPRNR